MSNKRNFFNIKLLFILIIGNTNAITWKEVSKLSEIYLYAGDAIPHKNKYKNAIGLSLNKDNSNHIKHDVTKPMFLPNNCVDIYQSEDVFEHIEYQKLYKVINEIYRVLKPGGLFRLSMPDYRCDILYNRSTKDKNGKIIFDQGGGGKFINGKIVEGGHQWFPIYEQVKKLLNNTKFKTHGTINYLHYYDKNGKSITKSIDYSKGFIRRTPDNDIRVQRPYRAMSIVIDLRKNS